MILVTGGTGCLGSNIARALVHAGERVAILKREGDDMTALADVARELEVRVGDVRDPAAVERAVRGVDAIYHLAALAVPRNSLRAVMRDVNVGGTDHVCAAALRLGVRRLVHTSTASAVGISRDGRALDERCAFNASGLHNSYIDTKRDAESVVATYVQRGLDAVIVNPTIVFAPGGSTHEGWASLVGRIAEGRLPILLPGGFGFCAGTDMVDGHLKAMAFGRTGERYLLNSQNLSLAQVTQLIARVLGVVAPRLRCPAWLVRCGLAAARLGALLAPSAEELSLMRDNGWIFMQRAFFDQRKAVRDLGMSQSALDASIGAMYAWWAQSEAGQRCTRTPRLLGAGGSDVRVLP